MSMSKGLRLSCLVVGVLALGIAANDTQPPSPQLYYGNVSQTAVLWFERTTVTTQIHGQLVLSGQLAIGDETTSFTTCGKIIGFGQGDTATLTGVMWAIFSLAGALETGEAVEIRGGLTVDSGDFLLTTEATGEGSGTYYLMLLLTDSRTEVTGAVYGSASGSFVRPDDPTTMQLSVSGTMRFEAASTTCFLRDVPIDPETLREWLPWDLEAWPKDLLFQLFRLLGEPSPEEGTPQSG